VALPERIRRVLPPDTARTWGTLASLVPEAAYLGGGTAIAVHLGHRVSGDLDFFYHHAALDLDQIADALAAAGRFAVTLRAPGTLNGLFSKTKVQFLHADEGAPQHLLAPPATVEGLRIATLEDLLAMKLKVVGDRGELRDYFDLMAIEQRAGRTVEEGLSLFLARFAPAYPQQALGHIVLRNRSHRDRRLRSARAERLTPFPGEDREVAELTRHAHRRWLHLSDTWPWHNAFLTCWQRLTTLPAPG
jgi:hypothetical protein